MGQDGCGTPHTGCSAEPTDFERASRFYGDRAEAFYGYLKVSSPTFSDLAATSIAEAQSPVNVAGGVHLGRIAHSQNHPPRDRSPDYESGAPFARVR